MSTSQMEGVTAVDMMIESLLDEILRLVACQLCNPEQHTHTFTGIIKPSHIDTHKLHVVSTWCRGRVPGVEEDELHVQAGSEHEHVAVQFDLRDRAGRQRVSDGHQPHVLVAAVKRGHVQAVLTDLQVATAVDHLVEPTENRRSL